MERLEKEYREFGPWIIEIKSEDDIPHLFANHFTYSSSVECALKIPIALERRKAAKGMDLYRSVVSFNTDEIIILEKTEEGITEIKVPYSSIKAVKNMVDLLEAVLTIFTENKNHSIKYNSISEEIMNNVIEIIREKYRLNTEDCRIETQFKGEVTDQLFRNLINLSRKKEEITAVSFQKTKNTKKVNMTLKDYILFNFNMELQSYIYLRTKKELIAVTRNKEIKKKRAVDYSYNYTYIPFSNIHSAVFVPDQDYKDIYRLKISLEKSDQLEFTASAQTKEDFTEILDIYSY